MIAVQLVSVLAGELLDAVGRKACRLFPIGVQRVAGQIEAADLFLLLEQFGVAVLREGLYLVAVGVGSLRFSAHHREQVQLSLKIAAGVALHALDDAGHGFHKAVAVDAHTVEGTRLDKTFHSPAVQLSAVHPLTEIIEARIRLLFSLFHDSLDEVAAHILDRIQAETDLAVVRCEAAVRDIDVRRKHLDAQAGALARIFDDFVGIVKHTGEHCGHKLAGVMTLEISRLECDVSVAGRMAFIEGVGRKT